MGLASSAPADAVPEEMTDTTIDAAEDATTGALLADLGAAEDTSTGVMSTITEAEGASTEALLATCGAGAARQTLAKTWFIFMSGQVRREWEVEPSMAPSR